ncbi:hypothetical protein BDZ85DRAFT_231583 [Elsinoe ampelina]|uniref:3-beta hydroxysteroid dehydrogenase/isomerase domain-containing protein n=1 Tax=Elsinoe ampelina TaxID=302913 RepID=A0A6A6GIW6_9PEZI|nr:hypothetical protein BDZ85DRAFT_231583 [Elsinoe ampelina]
MSGLTNDWTTAGSCLLIAFAIAFLIRLNYQLKLVPAEISKLSSPPWTPEMLQDTYRRLEQQPVDYLSNLPPRLDRRYIITGGNGLVGGYIVLQLLARGTPPANIRILDIRKSQRDDINNSSAAEVDFIRTDITSAESVKAAFEKPWQHSAQKLPLTVFHTAAIILASENSQHTYRFSEAVNVTGTKNLLAAARAAGADVFSATSSASIGIRIVKPTWPWAAQLPNFWQLLDEQDFFKPLVPRCELFSNYAISKAVAERLVCDENSDSFRTGTIRPANGIYGHPVDNTLGVPLAKSVLPTWVPHIVQSFVHAANISVAHLHHEAVLATKDASAPQTGRPFVITDPNPPIRYQDMYTAIETLSRFPFRCLYLPPGLMFALSYLVEFYTLLPHRLPLLKHILPVINGDLKHLQPGLFSICTHAVGIDTEARKPVEEGGLGYEGLITTLDGMALEILEWNREHQDEQRGTISRKSYVNSLVVADEIRHMLSIGGVGSA